MNRSKAVHYEAEIQKYDHKGIRGHNSVSIKLLSHIKLSSLVSRVGLNINTGRSLLLNLSKEAKHELHTFFFIGGRLLQFSFQCFRLIRI